MTTSYENDPTVKPDLARVVPEDGKAVLGQNTNKALNELAVNNSMFKVGDSTSYSLYYTGDTNNEDIEDSKGTNGTNGY